MATPLAPPGDEPPPHGAAEKSISLGAQHGLPHPNSCPGKLVPLRTLEEIKAAIQTTDCYILPIPAKSANAVLTSLRTHLPALTPLQHLRRLVSPSFLPASVAPAATAATAPAADPVLYLLVCPTSDIAQPALESFLRSLPALADNDAPAANISTVPVPACPPVSAAQAAAWSARFWPAVYKRGNPYGPHPAAVEAASRKLARAPEYMRLARRAGHQAAAAGVGVGAGCVLVDPDTGGVVAVAGDGRRAGGSPLDHAVLRAVAMVAQKRVAEGVLVAPENPVRAETEVEGVYFGAGAGGALEGGENAEGYLCRDMHVYLSHEPCVMCAMALLHSRVGVVVFGKRVRGTGALVAEDAGSGREGYGLFWRPELNWKFLCWQWVDGDEGEVEDGIYV